MAQVLTDFKKKLEMLFRDSQFQNIDPPAGYSKKEWKELINVWGQSLINDINKLHLQVLQELGIKIKDEEKKK